METVLKLKLIGFIKEYNNIGEATVYSDIFSETLNDTEIILKSLDYLNDGVIILSWMGYFFDIKGEALIAPDSYYTDGFYIWPAYFPFYLKKYPNYKVDKDFLEYISKVNY